MSETNSRVISLTSRRSRGVKASTPAEGCHCRADAIASTLSFPLPLSPVLAGSRDSHRARVKGWEFTRWVHSAKRPIDSRLCVHAALKQCRQVYGATGCTPFNAHDFIGGNRSIRFVRRRRDVRLIIYNWTQSSVVR